jgi:hypothetical protein
MKTTASVDVLQIGESRVTQSWQYIFIFGENIWSKYDQGVD